MTAVNLTTVILSLISDPSVRVTLDVRKVSDSRDLPGEVRLYAGGRSRAVSRRGRKRTVALSADLVQERDALRTLESFAGQSLCYRDPRGRKVFGVFWSLDVEENVTVDVAEVSLTLTEITYSEAV